MERQGAGQCRREGRTLHSFLVVLDKYLVYTLAIKILTFFRLDTFLFVLPTSFKIIPSNRNKIFKKKTAWYGAKIDA